MTRDTLIKKVAFINNDAIGKEMQMYGFVKGNDTPWKLTIDGHLEKEIVRVMAAGVKSLVEDANYTIVNFSTADERKERYYIYDLGETPERMACMKTVIGNADINDYDFGTHSLTELDHLIIVITDGGSNKVSIYKQLSGVEKITKTNKSVLTRIGVDNERIIEEKAQMLRIGPNFQVIWVADSYVVLNDKFLESNFKMLDILNNEAKKHVKIIKDTKLLLDVKKLEKYQNNTSFSRKLIKVMKDSYVIKNKIKKDEVILFIEGDAGLKASLPIVPKEGEKFIKISKKEHANAFLDLMNDEFLFSKLTKLNYQAPDKDVR